MKIPVLHIKDGVHRFQKALDADTLDFFRKEFYPEPIQVDATVNKYNDTIRCAVSIETNGLYSCDRCLVAYQRPIKSVFELVLQKSDSTVETDEENVYRLDKNQVEYDLTDVIIEHLILAVPMKMVCRDECQGICAGCGRNLNDMSCTCEAPDLDPRWEKLRSLRQ